MIIDSSAASQANRPQIVMEPNYMLVSGRLIDRHDFSTTTSIQQGLENFASTLPKRTLRDPIRHNLVDSANEIR